MNSKRFIQLAMCVATVAVFQQQAFAEDGEAGAQLRGVNPLPPLSAGQANASGTTGQTASSTKNNPAAAKKSFNAGKIPVYLAGVTTGAFVGMPINLVRRFFWEEKNGIQGMCGESKNKVAVVSAGAFWLPFSAFLGACEAPVMGPVNSLKNYDKPFSKDQFSLGKLGDGSGRDPE